MFGEGEFSEGVIIADQSDGFGMAYLADNLDARARFGDTEAIAGKDMLVTLGMQFGKTLAELKLFAIDRECAVGAFLSLHGIRREAYGVDTEEVAHARLLEFEVTSDTVERHHMDDIFLHGAEYPLKHIIEVDADVGSNTPRLMDIAFPRTVVPLTTAGDVGKIDIVNFVFGAVLHLVVERTNLVVEAELEDSICLVSRLLLEFDQVVDIVGIEHQWFLANHIAPEAQAVANEGIVGIVRRTDREPRYGVIGTHLLGAETVELLILGKERAVGKTGIESAYGIKLVVGNHKIVARIGNGFDVSRGDISRRSDECKIKF